MNIHHSLPPPFSSCDYDDLNMIMTYALFDRTVMRGEHDTLEGPLRPVNVGIVGISYINCMMMQKK